MEKRTIKESIDILYSEVPQVPRWAHALMYTYLEMNPPEDLQRQYRDLGYDCHGYWASELLRIFTSRIYLNQDLLDVPYLDYYYKAYHENNKDTMRIADMRVEDMTDIFHAYCCHMGMHWGIFPFGLKDILRWINGSK